MMRLFAYLLCLALSSTALAQHGRGNVRRDPMTDKEVEQMREFRDQPDRRVKVLNQIIQKRIDLLAEWEKDVKSVPPSERGQLTHDLLEDITNLLDEFGDNVDTFLKEQADIRKPLHESVTVLTSLQSQLSSIKTNDAQKPWFPDFSFPLNDALDAVEHSLKDTNDAIQEDERILQAKKDAEKQRQKSGGRAVIR